MPDKMGDDTSVKVCVRIRPKLPREIIDMCHICTSVTPGEPQVWLGKDKAFTFDNVFDMQILQEDVYETGVNSLVDGCFEGYNATVLAYGQTGSGKTYTMGTGFDINVGHEERGIIPRAVEFLFHSISERHRIARENGEIPPEFKVNAQFMELYNEEIIDLLDPVKELDEKGKRCHIKIHEDSSGGIYTVGVTTRTVMSVEEALQCLKIGALSRTTASTRMNAQSSRSHAIFTLHIRQHRVVRVQSEKVIDVSNEEPITSSSVDDESLNEFETLTAKFHFVDLAGSERLKRTGATGERAKEGISINCGLLALGNVISALGDKSRRVSHVPYRDSKLTRLLQDSLGGNSRTVMIACVSPSDRDFMETLNTLKYANRAKNIKNKVMINQDKSSQTISILRQEIQQLQLELMEYKQGKRLLGADGTEQINDMFHENNMLQAENNTLRTRIKALQETVERLTIRNTELLAEKATGTWITSDDNSKSDISGMIQGYLKEIEELRAKLMESEEMCAQLRKQPHRTMSRLSNSPTSTHIAIAGHYDIRMESSPSVYELLEEAKQDVKNLKKKKKALKGSVEKEAMNSDDEKQDNQLKSEADYEFEVNGDDNLIDDESSESENEEQEDYSENIAELTCEISIKQRLIEQLELSQRRLQTMRQHYEEKLIQLQNKIKETEKERDRVLGNLSRGSESQSEEKVRKVRDDFERKLNILQNEMKKMQAAKKEHSQMMKNQAQYEQQMKQLRQEVSDMKKAKVRLVHKMKEEAQKHKEVEQKRNREIAKLKKESRMRENQIRTLEAEKKLKEAVLRRKQEEVSALRKLAKPMSDKVAGRVRRGKRQGGIPERNSFSPKLAKQRWQTLEKNINKLVLNKQSIYTVEKDMERWLHEREKLSRCLEKVLRKRDRAIMECKSKETMRDLEEEIENLKANIDYIYENISDCQSSIVQIEESKDDMDVLDARTLVAQMQLEEAKYILEKVLNMAISQSFQVAQKETSVKELEAKMKQVVESNAVQQQLLQHVLHQANEDLYNIVMSTVDQTDIESEDNVPSISPVDNLTSEEQSLGTDSLNRKNKARKKTATTEELLFVGSSQPKTSGTGLNTISSGDDEVFTSRSKKNIHQVQTGLPSEFSMHKQTESSSDAPSDVSPPTSPVNRKTSEISVFSRLSRTPSTISQEPEVGLIAPFIEKSQCRTSPLVCTHIAEGHNKAVLCVEATDDVLFSSSKDRTVKIWDLHTSQEIQSLPGHPNNVVAVKYCEYTRLAFTVSLAYIKVWDVRENPSKYIKILCSSGTTNGGSHVFDSPSRIIQMPPGETQINDIALNHYGTTLFSAAGNSVRIWDLKMFQSTGKLNGSHQAPVMCLAVDDLGMDNNLIITGSKDHSIKVFEVMDDIAGIHSPRVNLEPPHYDGVQSLAIHGDFVFSGSRDTCIRKWDLANKSLVQSLNQAHRDWICALQFLPSGNIVLSGCRGGYVKLWATDTCQLLGEIHAHGAPINSIAVNSTSIFTASNDCSVGIWKLRSSRDVSPDLIELGEEKLFH